MHAHAKHAPPPHRSTMSDRAGFAHPGKNVEAFLIAPGMIVADFGAGSGHYTFEMAKLLQGSGRVYAIDVQQDLLRRIKNEADRRALTNIETIWGDIERAHGTRLAPLSVDTVLLSNVLFQLEQPKRAFDEARRVLKLQGRLIVIDWIESFRNLGPTKHHVFDRAAAIDCALASGFETAEHFHAGAHHYGLTFRKSSK